MLRDAWLYSVTLLTTIHQKHIKLEHCNSLHTPQHISVICLQQPTTITLVYHFNPLHTPMFSLQQSAVKKLHRTIILLHKLLHSTSSPCLQQPTTKTLTYAILSLWAFSHCLKHTYTNMPKSISYPVHTPTLTTAHDRNTTITLSTVTIRILHVIPSSTIPQHRDIELNHFILFHTPKPHFLTAVTKLHNFNHVHTPHCSQ